MRLYKKILIYTGIALFCFTGFDSFQIKDYSVFIKKIDAFAADAQKEKPEKDKKVDVNPCIN